jgi:hypothetical protein
MYLMELQGEWVMANLVSVGSERVLVSVQDMCTVCTERTVGLVTILDKTNGTPRLRAKVEARFSLFGDSANLDAR